MLLWAGKPLNYHSQPIAFTTDVEGKQYLAPDAFAKRDENSRLGFQRLPWVAGDLGYYSIDFSSGDDLGRDALKLPQPAHRVRSDVEGK